MTHYRYWQLTEQQRSQARARFFDAGTDDGYWYELGIDGQVLCRNRRRPEALDHQVEQLGRRVFAAGMQ